MTPKFRCGATCIEVPDRDVLACESTTPRCNPHLEDCRKAGVLNQSNKDERITR